MLSMVPARVLGVLDRAGGLGARLSEQVRGRPVVHSRRGGVDPRLAGGSVDHGESRRRRERFRTGGVGASSSASRVELSALPPPSASSVLR